MATVAWNTGRYYYSGWGTWTFSSPVTSTILNGNQYLGTSSTGGNRATMFSVTVTPSANKKITALTFQGDFYNDSSSALGSTWHIYTYIYTTDPGNTLTRPTGYIGMGDTTVSSSTIGYRTHHLVSHSATLSTPITSQTKIWVYMTCNGGTAHPLNWLLTSSAHSRFTIPTCTVTETNYSPVSAVTLTMPTSAAAGDTITLIATATGGTPSAYDFQQSLDSGATWSSLYSGASSSYNYAVLITDNGAQFQVYASNADGGAMSNIVTLTVSGGGSAPVHILVNGVWVDAIPYVLVNGSWVQAEAYVLANGNWVKTS